MWKSIAEAVSRMLASFRMVSRVVWSGGKAFTRWTLERVVEPVCARVVQAPGWLASNVVAGLTAPFRAQRERPPSEGQGHDEGQAEIHRRLLRETPEARTAAEALATAERIRGIARRLSEGASPERLAGYIGRLPAPARLWLRSLDAQRLAIVAEADPAVLVAHLSGQKAIPGLPSLDAGAEAAQLGCAPEALPAARRFDKWRSGRAEAEIEPNPRRPHRRLGAGATAA